MKQCPKCEIDLKQKLIDSIEVDECEKCRGLWFDTDELRQAKDLADPDLNWMDFEVWKHEGDFKVKESSVKCPACKEGMKSIDYGDTSIEIDCCPTCKGIWLDAGEFTSIIEALEKELLSKSFSDYIKASIIEAKEVITGSESFSSEWKDFGTVLRMMQYRFFSSNPKLLSAVIAAQRTNPL